MILRALGAAVLWFALGGNAFADHTRLTTAGGSVHTWAPDGYDVRTAKIVVYLHGYYVDADEAWRDHRLGSQFQQSKLNALFVVCESPRGPDDRVAWPSLEGLLAAVKLGLGEDLPTGEVIVIGHSGGHWTLRSWLRASRIDTLVLLDAVYGPFAEVRTWVLASTAHHLIDIGELTTPWADALHEGLSETLIVDRLPSTFAEWRAVTGDARIVYVRSRVGHMELVTDGKVIPTLLAATDRSQR